MFQDVRLLYNNDLYVRPMVSIFDTYRLLYERTEVYNWFVPWWKCNLQSQVH